nr:hypothetical protein [Tanacetum cinerariifolium]
MIFSAFLSGPMLRSRRSPILISTTRPSLFVGDDDESNDDDDDACVEISLDTLLRSAAVIHSSGNQGGSFATPATEDSQGKGVMVDDAAAPSAGTSRSRPSSGPAPLFRNVFSDAIHTFFFSFSVGPYYATYPADDVAEKCEFTHEEWDAAYQPTFKVLTKEIFIDLAVCKTIVDQFPIPGEMVRVESLFDDQLTTKMSVLHCMMMSHGGELLARYRSLNQSQHEYVLSTDSRLKGYEEKSTAKGKERKKKIKSLTKAWIIFTLRFQGELLSLAASAGFKHGLSMHQTKDKFAAVLKKMDNFMPGAQDRLAEASLLEVRVSPPTKESTVTHASKFLELSANVNFTIFVVSPKHNEEMVNAEGIFVALDDAMELLEVGSGRVFSGPNDVVVALFASDKCDGFDLSFADGKEAVANSYGV